MAGAPAGLDRLFAPAAIAVVGASEAPGLARDLLVTLRARGYAGAVYPVNPHRAAVLGERCYPSLAALPAPADLAMVLTPPQTVPDVLAECGRASVAGAVVVTAGFAEMGPAGRALQARAGDAARAAGVRLLGPNAIGFYNVRGRVPAIAIPPASVPEDLRAGPVAVVSQSAGILISTMEYGAQIGLGFSLLVSTGNEEDLGADACLDHLADDPQTRVIGLVLETVRDGRRLLAAAARARAAGKHLVALKLGRSARGADAVRTHTAGLAGSAEVFDAVCRDAGIDVASTISGFADHLAFHGRRRPGAQGGLVAITISGGVKVLVADLAERAGVRLAELSAATRERLSRAIPSISVADNPLDVTAAAIEDEALFAHVVDALDADPDVGVIALVIHLKKKGGSPAHQRLIRRFVARHAHVASQLVVISSIPEGLSGYWKDEVATSPVPFLNDLAALAVLRGATAPAPAGGADVGGPEAAGEVRVPAEVRALARDARATLAEPDAYRLLEAAGIAVARYAVVASREAAMEAAEAIGYPLALKASAEGLAHKAALGLVRLDLRSAHEVARAYDALAAAPLPEGARRRGVVVQAMVRGVELLAGARVDPQFGPVLAVGLGGTWAEALRDVALALAPADPGRVRAMLEGLRAGPALREAAARGALDLDAAALAASRLSRLAVEMAGELASIEVNPLVVRDRGCVAVDALAQPGAPAAPPARVV
jgi:acyl-CoA synthetase (NDP forming)